MKVVKLLRAHVGVAAVSAAVILGGAGAATAVVATSADTPVVDGPGAPVQTTAPVGTTGAPEPVVADAPVAVTTAAPVAPVEPVQAATVEDVTPSPQVPAPQPIPEPVTHTDEPSTTDPYAPYVQGNRTYVPAPPPPIEYLPGEPGYTPPAD